jgi:hypothetical protein
MSCLSCSNTNVPEDLSDGLDPRNGSVCGHLEEDGIF